MSAGTKMMDWMRDLWPHPRSLTGHGVDDTLSYIARKLPTNELIIHTFQTGERVFDWVIPEEWNIYDCFIEHESGQKFAEFSKTNLHVLGYSEPIDLNLTLTELRPYIYTQPEQPDWVPYVTSYYSKKWGFCMSENDKRRLPEGNYRVVIDAEKKSGKLKLAEIIVPGQSDEEILFSTYICHPSMANNELSGIVLSMALIEFVNKFKKNPKYTYRFLFVPETIGAIAYLSKNLKRLKSTVVCGFVLSCVGDDRAFSQIHSRYGNTLADIALEAALIGLPNTSHYSFLERGSDERQFCAPGVDLPICGFSRSKYESYPEYHTNADDLRVVNAEGLSGSLDVMCTIIKALELGVKPKVSVLCEPQLGKRGLYRTTSQKSDRSDLRARMNIMAYSDGLNDVFQISKLINENLKTVIEELQILIEEGIVDGNLQIEKNI